MDSYKCDQLIEDYFIVIMMSLSYFCRDLYIFRYLYELFMKHNYEITFSSGSYTVVYTRTLEMTGTFYTVMQHAKCILMFSLIIKHILSQKSHVSNNPF